jgi:hypothetical protein
MREWKYELYTTIISSFVSETSAGLEENNAPETRKKNCFYNAT